MIGMLVAIGPAVLDMTSGLTHDFGSAFSQRLGNQGSNFYRWKRLLLENAEEVAVGCEFKDCIPPIYEPEFVSAAQADDWLAPSDLVIGLDRQGATKAYPIKMLNYHEVVNDRAGEEPILITYCPLCGSAVGFQRTLDGRTLTFGVSGLLHHSNLVMYDHETESFWDQITGEAIGGPHVADRLQRIPIDVVRWSSWRQAHPDTQVLSKESGNRASYDRYPYGDYRRTDAVYFGTDVRDDRLEPKTRIIGVSLRGAHLAVPHRAFDARPLMQTTLGETPVAIVRDPASGRIHAFRRQVEGETLSFRRQDHQLIDLETRSEWSFSGEAASGSFKGTRLPTLATTPAFWFAWAAYHPDTDVLGAAAVAAPAAHPWKTSVWWGYAVLGALAVFALSVRRRRHAHLNL